MKLESADERFERLRTTSEQIADVQLPIEQRVAAVKSLAEEKEDESIRYLFKSFGHSTPAVRAAILNAVLERSEYQSMILSAIEAGQLPVSALSAVQREVFLKHDDSATRDHAKKIFDQTAKIDPRLVAQFTAALSDKPDLAHGKAVFKKLCSNCHKVREIGFTVGPDLVSEFARSGETFVQDILAPAAKITAGYETYIVQTVDGVVVTGLISAESPTSITLRKEEGKEQIILRQDIETIRASGVSLMPDDLVKSLTPADVASVIGWLREGR
jgi:putative heme-binding domain-containing protein